MIIRKEKENPRKIIKNRKLLKMRKIQNRNKKILICLMKQMLKNKRCILIKTRILNWKKRNLKRMKIKRKKKMTGKKTKMLIMEKKKK